MCRTQRTCSLITLLSGLSLNKIAGADVPFCPSTQYLKKGSTGLINCSFKEGFFAVLWYNSTDIPNNEAVAVLQESVKSGIGYESGEFDVCLNGSLIIKNVTSQHDDIFTILKLKQELSAPDRFFTTVVVVADSISTFPVIEQCKQTDEMCILDWKQHSDVTCFIEDAPFIVSLALFVITIDGDRNISSDFSVTNQTSRITSSVTTRNPFLFSSSLAMLTCRANSPLGLLQENESHTLLLDEPVDWTTGTPIKKYFELGSNLSLNCSKTLHVVWQVMKGFEDKFDIILYATRTENLFLNNYDDVYGLNSAWSLVASDVRVEHEGLYRCISSNGIIDDVILYSVTLFVSPTTNHPVIEGCNHEQYCVIDAQSEGSITCTVRRIRPWVKLDVKTFNEEPSIHFYDKQANTNDNGDAYDISLTVKYRVEDPSKKRITLECRALGGYEAHFHSSTKFDVLILTGKNVVDVVRI
ncbi:hypothetical protein HOLleu_32322 [Holothuria leucospilota]|uniref:Immunoglobulin domain-containing protein n=1 Tax=Holothuria leucospilota TaxID=206669 RepID=A0A9Q0YSN6_HOLLE|nr:hypothetical protein HOLleu_32322 [Holothuria leucospilota]